MLQASHQTNSEKKPQRDTVIGDFLLKGAEGPVCRLNLLHGEVCWLSGAQLRDIVGKIPTLVSPLDYYPLLVFQVGSDDATMRGSQLKEISGP